MTNVNFSSCCSMQIHTVRLRVQEHQWDKNLNKSNWIWKFPSFYVIAVQILETFLFPNVYKKGVWGKGEKFSSNQLKINTIVYGSKYFIKQADFSWVKFRKKHCRGCFVSSFFRYSLLYLIPKSWLGIYSLAPDRGT